MTAGLSTSSKNGILLLLFGVAIVSVQDVLVKFLSSNFPIHEVLLIRYSMAILLFGWLVAFVGDWKNLRTQHPGIQATRGVLMFSAGMSYYLALSVLPIAETIALFFTAPLFVTIFSILFLGERVGLHRWGAVFVGFIGVLVMMRPGAGVFEPIALLSVLAAIFYALSIIVIRRAGEGESAIALAFYSMVTNFLGYAVVAAVFTSGLVSHISFSPNLEFLTRDWIVPSAFELGLILGVALITVIAFYSITQAYRLALPSLLSVFEYTALFWGILWGLLLWQEYPDNITLIGITLMISAGLYTIVRESGGDWPGRKWFTGRALSRFR